MSWKPVEMPMEEQEQIQAHPQSKWKPVQSLPTNTKIETGEESTSDFWKRGTARTAVDVGEGALSSIEWLANAINPVTHIKSQLGINQESGTEHLRRKIDESTGGYTKPQSANEKDFSDIAKFVGSSLPGGGGANGAKMIVNLTRRAILGAIGGVSNKVVTGLTGSEGAGVTASIAVPLLASLASRNFQNVGKSLYNQAMKMVPKGTVRDTKFVIKDVDSALKDIAKMRPDAEKDYAIKYLKSLKKDLASKKQISLQDILKEKRTLSAKASQVMGLYHDKKAPALLRAYNAIDQSAHDYGTHVNPKFGEVFQQAEEAWRVGSQTNTSMRQLFRSLRNAGLDEPGAKKALIKLMGNQALSKATFGIPSMLLRRSKEAFRSPVLRSAHGQSIIEGAQAGVVQQEQ